VIIVGVEKKNSATGLSSPTYSSQSTDPTWSILERKGEIIKFNLCRSNYFLFQSSGTN
jgi:hypothetical protein